MTRQEILKLWVEDLRANADKQGALRTKDDKFCCLGRLCELAVVHGVISPPERTEHRSHPSGWRTEHSA